MAPWSKLFKELYKNFAWTSMSTSSSSSDEFSQTIITIAAVSVSLLGNTINAIGYIIEKKAHINLQAKNRLLPASKQKSYATDCLWLSGFITFALGSLLHAGALAFGPQSLLTPVTSVTLVVNTFLAHKYLNEPLRKQDISICLLFFQM